MSNKDKKNSVEFQIGKEDFLVRGNLSKEMLLAVGANAAQDQNFNEHSKKTSGPDGSRQEVTLGTVFNVSASGNEPEKLARTGWLRNTSPEGTVTEGNFYISKAPISPSP